jgi:dephospho-CoA kinase
MRVGLTGGVASGKSTVGRILTELGAVLIDADALARGVVAPGTEGLALVVEEFGPEILAPDGSLDRAALGARIFADVEARRSLEAIIHPRVRRRAAEVEAGAPPGSLVVHDIPLLVETGQQADFDAVLVVDVPTSVQRQRMRDLRGLSAADADARLAAQATREDRLAVATYVVDNSGTPEDLRHQVTEVFEALRGEPGGPR